MAIDFSNVPMTMTSQAFELTGSQQTVTRRGISSLLHYQHSQSKAVLCFCRARAMGHKEAAASPSDSLFPLNSDKHTDGSPTSGWLR